MSEEAQKTPTTSKPMRGMKRIGTIALLAGVALTDCTKSKDPQPDQPITPIDTTGTPPKPPIDTVVVPPKPPISKEDSLKQIPKFGKFVEYWGDNANTLNTLAANKDALISVRATYSKGKDFSNGVVMTNLFAVDTNNEDQAGFVSKLQAAGMGDVFLKGTDGKNVLLFGYPIPDFSQPKVQAAGTAYMKDLAALVGRGNHVIFLDQMASVVQKSCSSVKAKQHLEGVVTTLKNANDQLVANGKFVMASQANTFPAEGLGNLPFITVLARNGLTNLGIEMPANLSENDQKYEQTFFPLIGPSGKVDGKLNYYIIAENATGINTTIAKEFGKKIHDILAKAHNEYNTPAANTVLVELSTNRDRLSTTDGPNNFALAAEQAKGNIKVSSVPANHVDKSSIYMEAARKVENQR